MTAEILRAALAFAGQSFEAIEMESTDDDAVIIARNAARAIRELLASPASTEDLAS